MAEAFAAEHSVSIDEILYEWPAAKLEMFYDAFARRKISDDLALRRSIEVAALWGNPNLDTEKDPELRSNLMGQVDEQYSSAIAKLYGDMPDDEDNNKIDFEDPFFGKMRKGLEERGIGIDQ